MLRTPGGEGPFGARPELDIPRRARRAAATLLLTIVAAIATTSPLLAATTVVHHGCPGTERVVALTLDDGYHPQAVRSILASLDDAGIQATFFPTSAAVMASPAVPWPRPVTRSATTPSATPTRPGSTRRPCTGSSRPRGP